jgi:histidine ammonia-lyase
MSAVAGLLCLEAEQSQSLAIRNGALALELVGAFDDAIAEPLHARRPHRGQRDVARTLRELLGGSSLLVQRDALYTAPPQGAHPEPLGEPVQQVYSFRCIPQIAGPVLDTLRKTWADVETEINSVTDNPIIDVEAHAILHGGNFHGDYIAVTVDQLKAGLIRLSILAERRINFLLNEATNHHRFPPFLNLVTPGLTLGLQGLQYIATSTTAINQSLAMPHAVHSIPTNADNQDVVSMGTDAALIAMRVAANALVVLAVEAITLCQAVDCAGLADRLSPESQTLYRCIRDALPTVREDRVLVNELATVVERLRHAEPFRIRWA